MAIEGRLRELALSDVLQLLDLSGQTGTLMLLSDLGERRATLWFERGAITGARAYETRLSLGHLLVSSGTLDQRQLEGALAAQRQSPGTTLGAMVVRLGLADAERVAAEVRRHVEQTVLEAMRWEDGSFCFEEGSLRAEPGVPVRLSVRSLLVAAARHSDELAAPGAAAEPGHDVVPSLVAEPSSSVPLDLEPDEWELLAAIDGERTLRALAVALGRSEVHLAKTLTRLVTEGVVALPSLAQRRDPAGSLSEVERLLGLGCAEQAWPVVVRLLAEFGDDAAARIVAGRVLLALRRWAEAAAHLSEAIRLDPLAAQAHFHLAVAAARTGEFNRAEQAWSTFLRLPEATGAQAETAWQALNAVAVLRGVLDRDAA